MTQNQIYINDWNNIKGIQKKEIGFKMYNTICSGLYYVTEALVRGMYFQI